MPWENPGFTPPGFGMPGGLDPMAYVPYPPGTGVNAPSTQPPPPNLVRPQNRPQQVGPQQPAQPVMNAPVSPGQSPPAMSAAASAPAATMPSLAPLAGAAPQTGAAGIETIFPAAQNQALQDFLRGTGGRTPGGTLPAGMAMPQPGEVFNGNNPLTIESYLTPSGGISGSTFGNGDIMAALQGNQALRQNLINQRNEAAMIPGAAANQAARFANGLFTDAQRAAIAQYGVNPIVGGGIAQQAANDASARTRFDTSRDRIRDQVRAGIVAQGGTPEDVLEGVGAFDAVAMPGASGAPAAAGVAAPAAPAAAPGNTRALEQFLRSAISGAGVQLPPDLGRGQSRSPLALPATAAGDVANNAITNFVHNAASAGMLNADNLPEIMSFMTQRFGSNRVDPWFQSRVTPFNQNTPQTQAIRLIQELANRRGANVGANQRQTLGIEW